MPHKFPVTREKEVSVPLLLLQQHCVVLEAVIEEIVKSHVTQIMMIKINKIRDLFKVKLYIIRSKTKKREREKKKRERKKRERDFKYSLTLILTGGS